MTTEELKTEFKKRGIHLVFAALEGDGALFKRNGKWYCFVNSHAPSVRQRWTMAHELGHFDLHRKKEGSFPFEDQDVFFDGQSSPFCETATIEHEANLYAAELLMPKEELLENLPDLYEPEQISSYVERLASKFEVSFEAMVRRLMDLRALRKDLGDWLLSGAAQVNMPTPNITSGETASLPKLPEKHLPVIYPEDAFPYNSEFRYPGDPPHWIRLRQPPPEGAKLFAQGIEVAGISFESARENALSFAYGKERSLELRRDPQNPYDQNAIEVIGHWRDKEGKEHSGLLGYVPRELAGRLTSEAPSSQLFATLETLILPRRKKSPGIRFSVWVSSSN
ncbi:MAG: ImmA/IrrE family metallo-endopeptidase [Caldiserica bacterium]|jgi:Zn-dependent peptidase ImmA (M78 family)|nr:ImmA/IrrE family metallo-endopeptidase [Caldisericota bacterium]